MSLYEEAWEKFRDKINSHWEWQSGTLISRWSNREILDLMTDCFEEARQEAEEYKKQVRRALENTRKEMEEWYKEIARLADKERQDR